MITVYLNFSLILIYCICRCSSVEIKPELKEKHPACGYCINYKYEGMLAHSFDRFYVVTKFILPFIQNLKFFSINYDGTCAYLNEKKQSQFGNKEIYSRSLNIFQKIEPYINSYEKQIKAYNNTAHKILENEINLMLLQIASKHKHGIITTLVSSFIGLTYEGISSFLHNMKHKALHKAVKAMDG